jgi:hypothetical protein
VYVALVDNINVAPPSVGTWSPVGPAASGIASLNGLGINDNNGILTLASASSSIIFATVPITGTIDLAVQFPIVVGSLDDTVNPPLTGAISLESSDGSVSIVADVIKNAFDFTVPPAPTALGYGSWYSNQTQNLNNGSGTIFSLDDEYFAPVGFAPATGYPTDGILVNNDGVYNLVFSIQCDRTGANTGDIQTWVRKSGIDLPYTNSQIRVQQNTNTTNTIEFIISCSAGDELQIVGWSNNTTNRALAVPISATTPVAIPSIIFQLIRLA